MHRPISRATLVALLTLGVTAAVLPVGTAAAEEVYVRPADGVFQLAGHGWGHGRGLSQWGAQGAATRGVTASTILTTYYPGTAPAVLADVPVRVQVSADDNTDVQVEPAAGLAVRDVATGGRWALPGGPRRWRFVVDAAGLHVQADTAAGWALWTVGGRTTFSGPLVFEGPATVRLHLPDGTARGYRGGMSAVRSGTASLETVNVVALESYLYAVVPRESPASFHPEALKAQAVAARSYTMYKKEHVAAGAMWDICDTTSCQVYGGAVLYSGGTVTSLEAASTTAAVDATRGAVRTYGGRPILAEFSSSNGGWSVASPTAPYLAARADPWDVIANPLHDWTATLPAAALEARWPVGRLERLVVVRRDGHGDWGGRVVTARLEGRSATGAATSVPVTGDDLRSAGGLRSTWWAVRSAAVPALAGVHVATAPSLVVRPSSVTRAYFDIRNTGTVGWPVLGLMRSAATVPSPAQAPTWIAPNRPGTIVANATAPGSTVVAPGQVARFGLDLAGNGRPEGTYTETFAVVWELTGWVPVVATVTYRVQKLFAGTLVRAPERLVVPRHGTAVTTFDVRNDGDMEWTLGGLVHTHTAGSLSPSYDRSWLNPGRPGGVSANLTRPGAASVAPGEVARFAVVLNGNSRPAATGVTERFGVVYEARAFLPLTVPVSYDLADVFTGTAVGSSTPVSVPSAGRTAVSFDVRNDGNMTWPAGTPMHVTALTTLASRDASWLAPSRPGSLVANLSRPGAATVLPGEVARFGFTLAGNGRPAGASSESYGVVWELLSHLPVRVAFRVTIT